MSSQEVIYYRDKIVTVTNARAIMGAETYSMANITSVSAAKMPADRTLGVLVAILGSAITACAGFSLIVALSSSGYDAGGAILRGMGVLFGLLVTGAGIAIAVMTKPKYIVRIGSASGEANALVSKDWAYIQKIVSAMNEAIVRRG